MTLQTTGGGLGSQQKKLFVPPNMSKDYPHPLHLYAMEAQNLRNQAQALEDRIKAATTWAGPFKLYHNGARGELFFDTEVPGLEYTKKIIHPNCLNKLSGFAPHSYYYVLEIGEFVVDAQLALS